MPYQHTFLRLGWESGFPLSHPCFLCPHIHFKTASIGKQPTITFCRELIEAADENNPSSPPVAFSSDHTRFQPFSSVSLLQAHPILPFRLNTGVFSPFWPLLTFFSFYAMFIAQIAGKFMRLFKIRNDLRKIRILLLRRKLCFGPFRVMAKKIFRQQRCSISTDSLAPG